MKSTDENIDSLSRAIMTEARSEADKVVTDAKAKADAIRQQAQQQAEAARKDILDRATQEAARIRSQKIAATQLKARTLTLDSREKLLDKVHNAALQELPSVQQWTDYEEIARSLLREAIQQLRVNEVQIRADRQTMAHFSERFLQELSNELKVQITSGEPLDKGTGVVVDAANGHLQFDNTLETRLERMWNAMRSQANHLLMGEAL